MLWSGWVKPHTARSHAVIVTQPLKHRSLYTSCSQTSTMTRSSALKRAIELDPNSSFARGNLGIAFAFGGERSRPRNRWMRICDRLSPRDYLIVIWHTGSAWAHLNAEPFCRESEDCAKHAIEFNPNFPDAHGTLAAARRILGA